MAEKDDFFDEKILEYRRQARKTEFSTLATGMYIQNEKITFSEVGLFNNQVVIMLPDSFVDMPIGYAKIKYPSEQRPQIIKTSLDTSVNFAFNLFNMKIDDSQIQNATKQFKDIIAKVNPAYVFYHFVIENEPKVLGWFDFKSYCVDANAYNVVFLTVIKNKLLHGMFSCLYKDALEWQDVLPQILRSIREEQ